MGIRRLGLTLAASLMLALVAATPAKAGQALVTAEGGKVTLEYIADPGETNHVTITQATGSFTVADATAAVTTPLDSGCAVASGAATCADPSTLGPIQAIKVDLGDLNDVVDINASVPSELIGRVGADDLTGGDGPDIINGGPEADTINTRGLGRDAALCDATDTVISDPDDAVPGTCPNNVAPVATITGGPNGPTNETSPIFSFGVMDPSETVTGFECWIDRLDEAPFFPCTSGESHWDIQEDGRYFLRVRALDDAPGAGPWTTQDFYVDTGPPQINITGPLASTVAQPTFTLFSPDVSAPVTFECAIDQGAFAACGSSYTTPPLANGSYVLLVRGTDAAGNESTTEVTFTVQVTPGGGGGTTTPPSVQPRRIIIESLVLISGRPVRMSRKGEVSINLHCAGNKTCQGRMSITTAEPVKRKSRKLETLGSKKFSIAANKKKNVRVRFSKSKRKLAKRLKRFKAKVVIREVDQRGNARISSRVFILRTR